jgi:hypothetical protein
MKGVWSIALRAMLLLWSLTTENACAGNYDPPAVAPAFQPAHLDLTIHGASKYEAVLFNAEHSAFTDRLLPGDREPRNPNHHRVILALSTAFRDAYLRGNGAAREWLDGAGPRSVMEPDDRWQFSPH